METSAPPRFRRRKTPPTDRFLGTYHHAPPQNTATASAEENELHEDDIFSAGDFSETPNDPHRDENGSSNNNDNSPPSSAFCTPRHHHHHHSIVSPNHKAFQPAESFGILAVLPEHKSDSLHHHVNQKTTVSSSSSSSSSTSSTSSSRLIPSIPKPPQERLPMSASFSRCHQHHHSAPVNVPVLSMAMRRARNMEFDEIDEDAEEADGEMLPPHEIVARAQSPAVACSVLEGVGRTLRGRDLRQVRNAVLRRTGFLD